MPDRTPAEKLKLKPGMTAALLYVPEGVELGVPAEALVSDVAQADFVVVFASTQAQAVERVTAPAPAIGPKTVAWIGYPKGSKAKGFDISRDTIAAFVRTVGLVAFMNFSIDETWSGIRVRPLKPGE